MRQQRSEAFRKFKKLLAEMRANLIAAGVDAAKIDKLDVDKAPKEEVIAAKMAILVGLRESPEYRAFCRIWTERSPQWWANMALLEQTDGVEHKVLKKASTALRQAFKTTYRARTQKDTPHARVPDFPTTPVTYVDDNGVESATEPIEREAELEPEEADAEARIEREIQDDLIKFLRERGWIVKETHGNLYQSGLPDLYCAHWMYGARWIEVKNPDHYHFENSQLEFFPLLTSAGIGVWVLTAATEQEYKKLFVGANWWQYLSCAKPHTPGMRSSV